MPIRRLRRSASTSETLPARHRSAHRLGPGSAGCGRSDAALGFSPRSNYFGPLPSGGARVFPGVCRLPSESALAIVRRQDDECSVLSAQCFVVVLLTPDARCLTPMPLTVGGGRSMMGRV